MKLENFYKIKTIEEQTVGKKRFFFRHEITSLTPSRYCVRDGKLKLVPLASSAAKLKEFWDIYLSLLKNPVNPFREGDLLCETKYIHVRKKISSEKKFYRVIQCEKRRVALLPFDPEEDSDSFRPAPPHESNALWMKVEIVHFNEYSAPKYGIRSVDGEWEKAFLPSIRIKP